MRALEGKKVVIIGGSYGMGYGTAELAIKEGAEVAIAARTHDKLAAAAEKLQAVGQRPVPFQALSIEDRAAVAAFLHACAPFDHLVLPGSTVKPILYDDLNDETARESFDSKFWGPFWAAYDARTHLREGGSVVFFTGVAAKRPGNRKRVVERRAGRVAVLEKTRPVDVNLLLDDLAVRHAGPPSD